MRHALLTSTIATNVAIYTYLPAISRDRSLISDSMINNNLYIEMHASHTTNHLDLTKQILENFFTSIQTISAQQVINTNESPEYVKQRVVFITIEKLIKTFPNISLPEAIDRFVIANGATAVIGACLKIDDKVLFPGLPTADNYNDAVVLYVLNDSNNHAAPIIKVTVRPKTEVAKQQILSDIPEVLDSNIYRETILNGRTAEAKETVGITAYFSNIMYINLKKYHISEVVHAP
ncbi:hypothetical protein FACS1894166_12080 [Bacilli bacterium]|nr:hypothetical protein FACS1894166_12080 [Bacilli bacterium]